MKEQSLKPVIEKLEDLFSKFNEKFYNNELDKPIITVSPDTTKGAYGWCTAWKAWSNQEPKKISDMKPEEIEAAKSEGFYEINICAEYLARPFEQICETLLHEMVHLYNLQVGVQDTSRSGTYHNKKYKEAAEQHGLTVEKDSKYGWTKTSLNDEAKAFVEGLQDSSFSENLPSRWAVLPKPNNPPANMFAPCVGALSGQRKKFMLFAVIAT